MLLGQVMFFKDLNTFFICPVSFASSQEMWLSCSRVFM